MIFILKMLSILLITLFTLFSIKWFSDKLNTLLYKRKCRNHDMMLKECKKEQAEQALKESEKE